MQAPAVGYPAAAPGVLGGTGTPGVMVRDRSAPVDIRWSPRSDANIIGRLSRGGDLGQIFAPVGGGYYSVMVDPALLSRRADGIVAELRYLGLVDATGTLVLGYIPEDNVIPALFGRSPGQEALAVAVAELGRGVNESPACSNRGPEVDKYTGISGPSPVTSGGSVVSGTCGRAWCAYFVRWCLNQVGVSNRVTGAARSVKTWGQSRGFWLPAATAVPMAGDLFFKPPSGSAGHPCDTHPCVSRGPGTGHVGFVLAGVPGGIITVEGNIHAPGEANDGVRSLYRPIGEIEGFVRIP